MLLAVVDPDIYLNGYAALRVADVLTAAARSGRTPSSAKHRRADPRRRRLPSRHGYVAYYPRPIPRRIDVSPANLMRLADAEAALGRLAGADESMAIGGAP